MVDPYGLPQDASFPAFPKMKAPVCLIRLSRIGDVAKALTRFVGF